MLSRQVVLRSPSRRLLQRVDLKLIQELRFRTDAPISDCNMALKECQGNLDSAAEWLQRKGVAKANKKEGRVTDNGVLVAALDRTFGGCIVSLCSETDFAARSPRFCTAAVSVKQHLLDMIHVSEGKILQQPSAEVQSLLAEKCKDALASAIAVLGENVTLKAVTPMPHPDAEAESDDVRSLPLVFGKYTHNSLSDGDVGSIVGLVALRRLPEWREEHRLAMDDVAQHFVGSSGDASNYVHQSFLGTTDTVGQWLKKHQVKLHSSIVMPFGKEPVITLPSNQQRAQKQKKQS